MNPLDILAEILNAGAGGGAASRGSGGKGSGGGADILKDILLGGGPQGGGPQAGGPQGGGGGSAGGVQFPGVLREGPSGGGGRPSAKELEDMLGVGRSNPKQNAPTQTSGRAPSAPYQPQAPRGGAPQEDIFGQEPAKPAAKPISASEHEQVVILIRAMIYASKADGRIDQSEQQAIIERVGNTNPETIKFLREEFANVTTAKDFAWTVPIGMESEVYAATIASIAIDQQSEIDYVKELAQGLRLSPKVCNQIHQQYGIKPLF